MGAISGSTSCYGCCPYWFQLTLSWRTALKGQVSRPCHFLVAACIQATRGGHQGLIIGHPKMVRVPRTTSVSFMHVSPELRLSFQWTGAQTAKIALESVAMVVGILFPCLNNVTVRTRNSWVSNSWSHGISRPSTYSCWMKQMSFLEGRFRNSEAMLWHR